MHTLPFLVIFLISSLCFAKGAEKSPFSGNFSLVYQSPFDPIEGQDPATVMSAGVSYNFSKETYMNFTGRYWNTMVGHANDSNTKGLADAVLSYTDNRYDVGSTRALGKDWGVNYLVGGIAPTSDQGQKAGLRFGALGVVNLKYKYKNATFSFSNLLTYLNYEWDTADPAGTQYNEYLMLKNSISSGISLNKKKTWNIGLELGHYTFRNTQENVDNAYSVSGFTSYFFSKEIMGTLTIMGSDRKHDNTNLFLYERMSVLAGLMVSI